MKKILAGLLLLLAPCVFADESPLFKAGPLEITVPLATARATYLYDLKVHQSLVGAETPILTLWNRLEGTLGAVTSLEGKGTPFVGGNILVGNLLDKYVTLPSDAALGVFGARDFNANSWRYGLKASIRLWQ